MRKSVLGLTASALLVGTLAGYEGYREHAYRDSVGVPTIARTRVRPLRSTAATRVRPSRADRPRGRGRTS